MATASAVLEANAIPIFVDVDLDTFNISPAAIEAAITPRTKGIIPVHFAGLPADMDAIWALARKHDLHVIEDASHFLQEDAPEETSNLILDFLRYSSTG